MKCQRYGHKWDTEDLSKARKCVRCKCKELID